MPVIKDPTSTTFIPIMVAPSAVAMSLTLLPTTPSGALWGFSLMMIALGCSLRFGRPSYLATA